MERDNKENTNNVSRETIEHHGKIIAHIFRKSIRSEGVSFLTPDSYTLQLGLIEHPQGRVIKGHQHRQDIFYNVDTTQEFIYVEKGKLRAFLFSDEWQLVNETVLSAGDFALFISGGHGFEVLEACRLIEIKQGPYPGDELAKIYQE